MAKKPEPAAEPKKRLKISQGDFPINSLEATIRVAQAIWDNFAGKGAAPHEIAMAMEISPTSSSWRYLAGSAIAYGITDGGYNANQINMTSLGRRIVAPTEEGDDLSARVDALLQPKIQKDFYTRYNRAKFPKDEIAKNVLVGMGIPKERVNEAFDILKKNGLFAGIIKETKTGPFVAIDNPTRPLADPPPEILGDAIESEDLGEVLDAAGIPAKKSTSLPSDRPKQLFVAHGKKLKPLEDLKKILSEFKIPYKVAFDEANKGRPISSKVAELMNECSAGIFIFTKDEKFFREDKEGNHEEVWRPSENVVYELGAANILWERKIIIVREDGVNFPSDFSDLGYITFRDGEIASKTLEIFKELIALELVEVRAV